MEESTVLSSRNYHEEQEEELFFERRNSIQLLNELKQTYVNFANHIKGWRTMNKNELANKYLEYEHTEPERSYYFSALMCRYWNNVYMYNETSQGLQLEPSDFTSWLAEALDTAFKYRKWTEPTNKLYRDPNGPDKVINRCIYSTRMKHYQYSNMDKRRVNYQVDSIERQLSTFGSSATVYDYLQSYDEVDGEIACRDLVKHYLSKDKIVSAIVVDLICFNYEDVFREKRMSKKMKDNNNLNTTFKLQFSKRNLLTAMRNLDDNYIQYFCSVYGYEQDGVKSILERLKEADNNKKFPKIVNETLKTISTDKSVGEILCL